MSNGFDERDFQALMATLDNFSEMVLDMEKELDKGANDAVGIVASRCPVVSGDLRRSIKKKSIDSRTKEIHIGENLDYAASAIEANINKGNDFFFGGVEKANAKTSKKYTEIFDKYKNK